MNRARVVVCLCLFLGWTVTGCQSIFGSNSARSGLSGSGPDGGACTKDPQAIKNVMLAPPMCSATNPCPCGTYCSSQTGGNCIADCVDDTWCAPGFTCSAFGQCLNANPPDGGGSSTTTNPTCPTNSTLLDSLMTNPRGCKFDDVCPFGSYCNHVTELCTADCRSDSNCASLNNADQTFVCDCLGQCAAVGVPKKAPAAFLPSVFATPGSFSFVQPTTITAPDWGDNNTRTISVSVATQFVNKSGSTITGPKVTVQANPGPGLMVQCPATAADGGASSLSAQPCSITFDPSTNPNLFTLQRNGTYLSAPVSLTVAPSSGAPTATNWSLRLDSTDVSNSPQIVNLRYDNSIPTLSPPAPAQLVSPPSGFRGTGHVQLTTPTGQVLNIPVKATSVEQCQGCGDVLVLYDDTQLLSPSGKLVLSPPQTLSGLELFIQPAADSDAALSTSLSGEILQRLIDAQLFQDATTGTLSGSFTRAVYTEFINNTVEGDHEPFSSTPPSSPLDPPMTATFSVGPTTNSGGFCNGDSDCAGGTHCDLGFCSSGPPHRTEADSDGSLELFHNPMRAWGADQHPSPIGVNETLQGFLSVFAPDSATASATQPNTLNFTSGIGRTDGNPLPFISGEPIASMSQLTFLPDGEPNGFVFSFTNGPLAIPLLTQHDGTTPESASQLLADCLTDLARTPAANRLQTGQPGFPSDAYDVTRPCINLGRVAGGLTDKLTFQRMLEGWLTVHSFVGREGLEEAQAAQSLADVGIDSSTTSTLGSTPTYEQLLGILESGLGLVLDQTTYVNGYYQYLSGSDIWTTIDYRTQNFPAQGSTICTETPPRDADCNVSGQLTRICGGPGVCIPAPLANTPQYEQTLGVPTFILETSTAYLRILQTYLQNLAAQSFGQAADNSPSSSIATGLARYGSGMRLVMAAEELAVGLNAKAGVGTATNFCPSGGSDQFAGDCAIIAKRFNAARDEMNTIRGQVVAMAQSLHDGGNPFNIPEDDVPLFFGDPSGTSSQYFAASDYLLSGWALPAVAQSQSFLDAARAAWVQQAQAAVQDELNQHNRQQEIDQLMSKYGSPILANCGTLQVPNGSGGLTSLDSTQVIPYFADPSHEFTDATNATCFIKESCIGNTAGSLDGRQALQSALQQAFLDSSGTNFLPATKPDSAQGDSYTNQDATLADLFVRDEVCKDSSQDINGASFPMVDLLKAACPLDFGPGAVSGSGLFHCSVHIFTDGDPNLYFDAENNTEAGDVTVLPVAALFGPIAASDVGPGGFYRHATTGSTTGIAFGNFVNGPSNNIYNYVDFRTDNETENATLRTAGTPAGWFQVVTNTCASGKNGHLSQDYPRPGTGLYPVSCYQGSLGVAFGQIQSDTGKVQGANDTLKGAADNVKNEFAACQAIDKDNASIDMAATNASNMENDYQIESGIVNGINSGLSGFASGGPAGAVWGVFSSGLTSVFGDVAADAQQEYQQLVQRVADSEKSTACWNEFASLQSTLTSATDNVRVAVADVNTQTTVLNNLRAQNLQNIQEGIAMYQQEQKDPVGSLGHQFWVDERITQYKKEFDWARRLTYLAMLAVEYEFQQTLPYRSQIVAAATPAQMQDAVIALQQEQVSREVNLRRPQASSIVLSLRDDVLNLPDDSNLPAGERNWTPAQRFESRLADPTYAYHDSQGNYLGQAIPFTLNPTGVLQTRCGERLWDVTATIQGDGVDESAPGASVLLLKRNTFQSQYCSGHAPATSSSVSAGTPLASATPQMQTGVIHDSADLFQPGSTVNLSDSTLFTAALLYPWFNIPKTEFYATSYQNGSSQELAGRGLYGDYVLLFPQQELTSGFALANIEDVLLRLDYLSIDNLSQ